MIKFSCMLCGEKLSVQDQLSGKRIKCPKCNNTSVVPAESPRTKFDCPNCGKGIRVLQVHAGKKGQCPKCKNPVVVPSLKGAPGEDPGTVAVVCSMCNEKIRVPKDSQERFTECPACGSNVETSLAAEPPEPDSSIPPDTDQEQYEEEYEQEDEGPDRRLMFAICGAAVVVVLGLIILVTVILPSDSGPSEEPPVSSRQEIADTDSPSDPVASSDQPAGTFTLEPPKENVAVKAPAGSPTEARDDAQNLDLKLRLKPGQKHKLQIVKEINSSQTTRGRQFDEEYINTMGLEIEVEQVDNSGVAWLKVTYLTIHEKITDARRGQLAPVMGYTFEYDSTKPETAVSYMNYGPLFTAMIGQSFRARVTSEGEIVELEGLAEMYQEMAELVVENEDEAIRQRMAKASAERIEERAKISIDQRNQHYGSREKRVEAKRESLDGSGHSAKGLIREMLGNVIMPFPGEPVGIGDSWLGKTPLFSVGAGSIGLDNCAYTLKESKQSAVLVDFGSKIEVDDELYAGERGSPGSMTIALAGSCQGSLEIDPSSGWMLHKTVTMHYSGERRMAPTQRAPQGLTTVMSMENVTTVKPIE